MIKKSLSIFLCLFCLSGLAYTNYQTSAEATLAAKNKTLQLRQLKQDASYVKKQYNYYGNLVQKLRNKGPEVADLNKKLSDQKDLEFDSKPYQSDRNDEIIRWRLESQKLNAKTSQVRSNPPTFPDHYSKISKLNDEIRELQRIKADGLAELKEGYYCSQCKRPKSQIEKEENETFNAHLGRVNGVRIPATQSMLNSFISKYDGKINNVRRKISNLEKKKKDKESQHQKKVRQAEQAYAKAEKAHQKKINSSESAEKKAKQKFERNKSSTIARLEAEIKKRWADYNAKLKDAMAKESEFFNKDLKADYAISNLESDIHQAELAASSLAFKEKLEHERKMRELKRQQRIAERKLKQAQKAEERKKRAKANRRYYASNSYSRSYTNTSNNNVDYSQVDKQSANDRLEQQRREREAQERLAAQEAARLKRLAEQVAQQKADDIESFKQAEEERLAALKANDVLSNSLDSSVDDYSYSDTYNDDFDANDWYMPVENNPVESSSRQFLDQAKSVLKQKTQAIVDRVKYNLARRGEQLDSFLGNEVDGLRNRLKGAIDSAPETFFESFAKPVNDFSSITDIDDIIVSDDRDGFGSLANRTAAGVNSVVDRITDTLNLKKRFSLNSLKEKAQSYFSDKAYETVRKIDYEREHGRSWEDLSGTEQAAHSVLFDVKNMRFASPEWPSRLKDHIENLYTSFANDFGFSNDDDGLIIDDE